MLSERTTNLRRRDRGRPPPIAPCAAEAVNIVSGIAGLLGIRRRRSANREGLVTAASATTRNDKRRRDPICSACRRSSDDRRFLSCLRRTSLMIRQVGLNCGVGRRRLDRIELQEQAQTVADFVWVAQFDDF